MSRAKTNVNESVVLLLYLNDGEVAGGQNGSHQAASSIARCWRCRGKTLIRSPNVSERSLEATTALKAEETFRRP
jgi:hypothetical protein